MHTDTIVNSELFDVQSVEHRALRVHTLAAGAGHFVVISLLLLLLVLHMSSVHAHFIITRYLCTNSSVD